jgi:hypothetical protein
MTKISSNSTFFYKKAFPILWFGFMAVCVGTTLLSGALGKDALFLLPGLLIPCLLVGVGFLLFRKLLWNLADEVYDGGDFLLVRDRGEEDSVPLANIVNVNASIMINPPRVTLRLARPGKFGTEISFSPKARFTLNPFAKSQVAEDLIVRVDQARSRRSQ